MNKIIEYALSKHGNQMYGDLPYISHLIDVYKILKRFGILDENLYKAALLHDIVEDTDVKIEEITELFGDEVSGLVWAVTSGKSGNRESKNKVAYDKIKNNKNALILKLADRIANMECCIIFNNYKLLEMYFNEYPTFKKELFNPEEEITMWIYLDELIHQTTMIL